MEEKIFKAKAINNKTVRYSELNILEKNMSDKTGRSFVFGKDINNLKVRHYNTVDEMKEDFNKLSEIRKNIKLENKEKDKLSTSNEIDNNEKKAKL